MKRIEDERILAEKRKVNSNAFGICFLSLWGILLYRQFLLQQDITQYADIFLLTIGLSIYVTVKSVFSGLYLTYRNKQSRKKANIIGAAVGSVVFGIVQYITMNYNLTHKEDVMKLILSIIIFLTAWLIAQGLLLNISEKKANEEIDDDQL